MTRPVPNALSDAVERASSEPAVAAVAASRSLHQAVVQWQVDLVGEALAGGASWEDVGEALGTTRQAAWARFRHAMDEGGQPRMAPTGSREHIIDIKNAGIARMRELEEQWKAERNRLRDEMVLTQGKLKEAQRLHVQRQREARQELRRALLSAKQQLRAG